MCSVVGLQTRKIELEREYKRQRRDELYRLRALNSLVDYARYIDVPGRPVEDDESGVIETPLASHHLLLLRELQRTMETRYGRLMVLMPPGSAKSTYASVVAPSWYLGRQPDRRIILASYGDDLARKMGRRTRSIIKQPGYQRVFGVGLTADSAAAQEFALTNGGEYIACGIQGGVTGNRAHGLLIDDPVKGREQAESETVRAKTWEGYQDDLTTRLLPGGWTVLVQTRWHQDDLAGHILPEGWAGESGDIECRDGLVWRVICLQARCERDDDPLGRQQGEYLWPEWFDARHWAIHEANSRTWASLYQQLPTPGDGLVFNPDKITLIDALPTDLRRARGWDLAATENGGDWTAGGLLGTDALGRFFIADIKRFQGSPLQVEQALKLTAAMDGQETPIGGPQDPGQAGKAQALWFAQLLAGYDVEFSPETGSKSARAAAFAAQVEAGNVYMLRAPWNKTLIDEMRSFPFGRHDDQVDALSRAFHRLTTAKRWVF